MPQGAPERGPSRILFIRHGELHETPGFSQAGAPNDESLTAHGWQRAGALVRRFHPVGGGELVPDTVFATGVGPDSESLRPQETVAPLVASLREARGVETCFRHLKFDTAGLAADIMTRAGVVLVVWAHSQIAAAIDALPNPPAHPAKWPDDRYDLVWRLERRGEGWHFSQEAQLLLPGDAEID